MDLSSIATLASVFGSGGAAGGGLTTGLPTIAAAGAGAGANLFPVALNPMMGPLAGLAAKGVGTILGMNPAQFASVFGQLANAIGGGNTLGARMGQVAAQMGMAQLQGALAKNQQSSYMKSLSEMLKAVPERKLGQLSSLNSLVGAAGQGGAPSTNSLLKGIDLGNIE